MPRFKLNERVCESRRGFGTVLNPAAYEPLVAVRFDNGSLEYYMLDGRVEETDYAPSIYRPDKQASFSRFKLSDRVFSITRGYGVVNRIDPNFIYVLFDTGGRKQFQLDGRVKKRDALPSLYFPDVKIIDKDPERTI